VKEGVRCRHAGQDKDVLLPDIESRADVARKCCMVTSMTCLINYHFRAADTDRARRGAAIQMQAIEANIRTITR